MTHTFTIPSYGAGLDVAGDAFAQDVIDFKAERYDTVNAQTTSYTLVLADVKENLVQITNGSANTLTVPPNSSVAFPIGSRVRVLQAGAGQTTLTAGGGVTIQHAAATLKLTAQWSVAMLVKVATDVWVASGDLAAS